MKHSQRGKRSTIFLGLCVAATSASAQSADKVERVPMANPDIPIAAAVVVPAGYDTIYVSGHVPKVAKPDAAKGSTEMYGDTKTQTTSVLQQISDVLAAQTMRRADHHRSPQRGRVCAPGAPGRLSGFHLLSRAAAA